MKYSLTTLSVLFFAFSYSQIIFSKIPQNLQLIGRDLTTNMGYVIVEGEVNNASVNYDGIKIEVYKNNQLQDTYNSTLNYMSNKAPFNFDMPILAELANYSIKIYGKQGSSLTLEREVIDIVAGDVYIIQGQSNAEARVRNGSSSAFQDNFIRVFAKGVGNANGLLNNSQWYIGNGDGNSGVNGNTGQWGLKLAKSIIDDTNIPVAIFNGAHVGKEIAFFKAPNDYQTSLNSNYGRLYYRLSNTGLKNYVRAVFWSQGERDSNLTSDVSTLDYKNEFTALKNSWLTDYSNIEKIYIFQTKNGCNKPINIIMQIKEAQRQLAAEDPDISIMSTAGITHHTDNCHFPFVNGYELFASRIFPLIQRDLYGKTTAEEIDTPMVTSAYLSSETTLVVETDANDLRIASVAENFELSNSGEARITNIAISGNKISFTLSESPGSDSEISYLAQPSGVGKFITNSNNLELISFYKYPVSRSNLSVDDISKNDLITYTNSVKDVLFIKLPAHVKEARVQLAGFSGKQILNQLFYSNNFEINLPNTIGIYLLIVKTENGIHTKKILMQ